jgi:hypothetical protein
MAKDNRSKNQYRSMRGKMVDMDMLRKRNELTPAVGNAKVNARGDVLGAGGKIVKRREDIVKEYYENNPNAVKSSTNSSNTKKTSPDLTPEEQEIMDEATQDDEWIEDDEGNFIKKGE